MKTFVRLLVLSAGFLVLSSSGNVNLAGPDTLESADIQGIVRQPDAKVIASIMLEEKKAGTFDDAPYVAYLVDSLGFRMTRDEQFHKVFVGDFCEVSLETRTRGKETDQARRIRNFRMKGCNVGLFYRELLDFGLVVTERDGAFMDLKGKGLFAATGSDSVSLNCSDN